jgi:hypothetical protein
METAMETITIQPSISGVNVQFIKTNEYPEVLQKKLHKFFLPRSYSVEIECWQKPRPIRYRFVYGVAKRRFMQTLGWHLHTIRCGFYFEHEYIDNIEVCKPQLEGYTVGVAVRIFNPAFMRTMTLYV